MKKVAILVSVVFAMVLTFLGVKSVSANGSVPTYTSPSYCVVFENSYDSDTRKKLYDMMDEKIKGNMVSQTNTENAMTALTQEDGTVDFKALGTRLGVDYVVLFRMNDDMTYDGILHNVAIDADVIEPVSGQTFTKSGNVIVPTMNTINEEIMAALREFLDEKN